MMVEKKNGGYSISTLKDGYLVTRFYLYYTRKEALEQFKNDIKGDN